MKKYILLVLFLQPLILLAQNDGFGVDNNNLIRQDGRIEKSDSTKEKLDFPVGIYAWSINPRFGSIQPVKMDTASYLFQNSNLNEGKHGHYNHLGNMGAPRYSRLYFEKPLLYNQSEFIFERGYDLFLVNTENYLFYNTKSPFTNITYHECGNKQNGEDRIKAYFSSNVNKKFGVGFNIDYLYGRGYYDNQSTAFFRGSLFGSYIDKKYQAHFYYDANHLKMAENGGITDDGYITNPQGYSTRIGSDDIPVHLNQTWNRLNVDKLFFTHSYNLGITRHFDEEGNLVKEEHQRSFVPTKMDSIKNFDNRTLEQINDTITNDSLRIRKEYIPVTSFIHTLSIAKKNRRYIAYELPENYYAEQFYDKESIDDKTKFFNINNLFALELHEGFNKWAKAGMHLYFSHEYYRYTLPKDALSEQSYHENYFTLGAQLYKHQGHTLHYNLLGEMTSTGDKWGIFKIEGNGDLNIPLFKDTLQFKVDGSIKNEQPNFYLKHYHSQFAWWDKNFDYTFTAKACASINYGGTKLSAGISSIQNYTYLSNNDVAYTADETTGFKQGVNVFQTKKNIQVYSFKANQNIHLGIFHWENEGVYQFSSAKDILPLPLFTFNTNLYLRFRIAKVLKTELGASATYFSEYYAPTYSPIVGQFVTQSTENRIKIGDYPIVNIYLNFHLKQTRFYVSATHVNKSSNGGSYFLVPHYPINPMNIRFGISWNFLN